MCIINNEFLYVGRKMSDLYFIFAVDMKLQKLLRKCDFDKMFEYIVMFDSKSEGSRFAYLVAYELLCDMEAEEGREYDVVPNPYAKESEGPASEITVWCSDLEGCNWQKALGAEMNFCPEAEKVPLDMIAGICLWHITFYGFNPDEEEETFNQMGEDESSEDGPAYLVDILSEETKALRPDLVKLGHKEYEKQFRVYRKAYMKELKDLADQGDEYGQFFLAEEYRRGVHKKFINLKKAFPLYQASAEQGLYRAQVMLAFCYEYGLGTEEDLDKARAMFKLAGQSEKGHGKPEEHLAMLEVNEENYAEALSWFKEAQRKGNHTVKSYIWYLERNNYFAD